MGRDLPGTDLVGLTKIERIDVSPTDCQLFLRRKPVPEGQMPAFHTRDCVHAVQKTLILTSSSDVLRNLSSRKLSGALIVVAQPARWTYISGSTGSATNTEIPAPLTYSAKVTGRFAA